MAYKNPTDPRSRAAKRRHYESNKDQYKERNKKIREKLKAILIEAKSVPCFDCEREYPSYVMDFDHQRDKKFNVAAMISCGSEKALREEIAKCQVVCANCHRIRTHSSMV